MVVAMPLCCAKVYAEVEWCSCSSLQAEHHEMLLKREPMMDGGATANLSSLLNMDEGGTIM